MSFCDNKNNNNLKIRRKDKLRTAKTTSDNHEKAYLTASATVEAALVLPIYIYGVLAIAYLIISIGIRVRVSEAMYDSCRQLAKNAYVLTLEEDKRSEEYTNVIEQGISTATAYAIIMKKIEGINSVVSDFNISASHILNGDNDIDIVASYYVKNPFDVFGIGKIQVKQRSKTSAWLGEKGISDITGQNGSGAKMVYITRNGTVYHISKTCSYLDINVHTLTYSNLSDARNLDGGKYYECERCKDCAENTEVYVTDYGNKYHKNSNCTAISREVLEVPKSSVLDRLPCSKCGGK